jgi:hypothetical protein
MTFQQLTLVVVDGVFAVCRLEPGAPIPIWSTADDFFSITRTADELSVVCRQDAVPDGINCERGWRCLRVAGTIPFSVVGVLASLTAPLAEAGISVFTLAAGGPKTVPTVATRYGSEFISARWNVTTRGET